MEAKATAKYIISSPRKIRLVADQVRGFSYPEALDILKFIPRRGSALIQKVLESARSNAKQQLGDEMKDAQLYVKKVYIDEGPRLKRFRPRARGRGMSRLKRTSHITVVLGND
jgi:large subunit ribosomal protein L22